MNNEEYLVYKDLHLKFINNYSPRFDNFCIMKGSPSGDIAKGHVRIDKSSGNLLYDITFYDGADSETFTLETPYTSDFEQVYADLLEDYNKYITNEV